MGVKVLVNQAFCRCEGTWGCHVGHSARLISLKALFAHSPLGEASADR